MRECLYSDINFLKVRHQKMNILLKWGAFITTIDTKEGEEKNVNSSNYNDATVWKYPLRTNLFSNVFLVNLKRKKNLVYSALNSDISRSNDNIHE